MQGFVPCFVTMVAKTECKYTMNILCFANFFAKKVRFSTFRTNICGFF